jgi:hypothetical protein
LTMHGILQVFHWEALPCAHPQVTWLHVGQ